MKTLFRSQGPTDIIEKHFEEWGDESDLNDQQRRKLQKNREKDGKAMTFIQIGMEELIFQRIRNVRSAKQAWEILENTYQGTSKVKIAKLQAHIRSFGNLQMKE